MAKKVVDPYDEAAGLAELKRQARGQEKRLSAAYDLGRNGGELPPDAFMDEMLAYEAGQEAAKPQVITCRFCQTENPPRARRCEHCGAPLTTPKPTRKEAPAEKGPPRWKLLVPLAIVAGIVLIVLTYHAPHVKNTTPPTTPAYPAYTVAQCQRDAQTENWQWMDDNGTPVLCGQPKGNEPQPPLSPYYPPNHPAPQSPDLENYGK